MLQHLNISLFFSLFLFTSVYSEVVKKINITGNDRIPTETIKLFSKVNVNDDVNENTINEVLKNLYDTDYFSTINVSINNNVLNINVIENPLVYNVKFKGLKSDTIKKSLLKSLKLKERTPYNEIYLIQDKLEITSTLRKMGYFFSKVDIYKKDLSDNRIDVIIDVVLGEKSKIKKISFIGDKKFKNKKLLNIIISEEFKFWKFISGKKYLNESLVEFDTRLLENFYKNNGYYNVKINSSFAKLLSDDEFELIFNIDAKSKVYLGELKLTLPSDFNEENFIRINKLFNKVKNKPYSINFINKILKEIDLITAQEQYQFINAFVDENIIGDKINLNFKINETKKYYVEKINIFGNNVTAENVIRNQFEVDEGDPFNEILVNKSFNNLKSLGYFKTVDKEIINLEESKTKIINVTVTEQPTGEINASAGVGTSGNSIGFGVKENNFLGQGIRLNSDLTLATDSLKGKFSITNPNYKNSDKSIYLTLDASETDNYKKFGYKTNKTGFTIGTNFEYYDDFFLGVGTSNFYEKIETNSTASARQQAQEGDYLDSFLKLDFNYDKRNQKFQTSSGFKSFYSLYLHLISDTNNLKNYYNYYNYFDLFEKNISSIAFYFETANSINNKDIKLSERINIPTRRLRGFESGRVGPKDGDDFIGGNFAYSINFSSNIPQFFEESQDVEFLLFTDIADIWGVDYDSSLNDSKIRSSIGLALDWFSPVGPMNFSLSHPISKADTDKTESFRFNLGTSF